MFVYEFKGKRYVPFDICHVSFQGYMLESGMHAVNLAVRLKETLPGMWNINSCLNTYVHSCSNPCSNEPNPCSNHEIYVLFEHGF